MPFLLTCNDCSFETVMDIDVDAVFDVIDQHRKEYAADRSEHYVDFERLPGTAES